MRAFGVALGVEVLKLRKSKMVWLVAAAFSIAPVMAAFFMYVLKDPERARDAGLLGAKAQIAGEATWPAYIKVHAQMIAVGGLVVFGFVMSWIFGREYADGTVKDLLVLPVSRGVMVLAKFVAGALVSVVLSAYVVAFGFVLGWVVGLPGWSASVLAEGLGSVVIATGLTIVLCMPVAFLASVGGGYLAPLGFVVVTLVLSQIIAAAGFGAYFPWSVPALVSGVTKGDEAVGGVSVGLVGATGVVGVLSTWWYWVFADQH